MFETATLAAMARPTHCEIPVDDPDRAEKFYGDVFGWTFQRFEGAPEYYGLATTGDEGQGINGALFQRGTEGVLTLTMSVDSIEDAIGSCTTPRRGVVGGRAPRPARGWVGALQRA